MGSNFRSAQSGKAESADQTGATKKSIFVGELKVVSDLFIANDSVKLGLPSVNSKVEVNLPSDRLVVSGRR